MWVMSPDGIGIIFDLGDVATVHLVSEDGTTKDSRQYPLNSLRQASWEEIPGCRRLVSKEVGLSLGYK